MRLSRRRFLTTSVSLGAGAAAAVAGSGLAGCSGERSLDYAFPDPPAPDRGLLEATPPCPGEPRPQTALVVEGPYYLPKTPERQSLAERGDPGQELRLVGLVMNRRCEPIPGAVLDFWQADPEGSYDAEGMTFRGHQFTDAAGAYQLRTRKPGRYTDGSLERCPHLHVKVQGPGTGVLTTQLYFPDEPDNADDPLFVPETVMEVRETPRGQLFARFDFVLETP